MRGTPSQLHAGLGPCCSSARTGCRNGSLTREIPYLEYIDTTRFGVMERLQLPNRQLLAFQSRTGPVKWIGPGTEESAR